LARHETNFEAAGEVSIGLSGFVGSSADAVSEHDRQQAIICVLSGADGWQDAVKLLGGAFAPDAISAAGLTRGKAD
jgi:hypothetical protein